MRFRETTFPNSEIGNLGTVAKSMSALHFDLILEKAEIRAIHSERTAFQGYKSAVFPQLPLISNRN